jgi:hypothetical protein
VEGAPLSGDDPILSSADEGLDLTPLPVTPAEPGRTTAGLSDKTAAPAPVYDTRKCVRVCVRELNVRVMNTWECNDRWSGKVERV